MRDHERKLICWPGCRFTHPDYSLKRMNGGQACSVIDVWGAATMIGKVA
jgi:hypothetical protein